MLKKSFQLFFIDPIAKIYEVLKRNILFVLNFFKEMLLLKFEPKNDEDTLAESFKIFRIIIAIIIFNISWKEISEKKDSNFLLELSTDLLISLVYFVFLMLTFYIGLVFDKIYKSKTLTSFSTKLWNFYALILIILLALFNGLSGEIEKSMEITVYFWLFIITHLLLFYFNLIKTNIFRRNHIIYLLIISIILLLEIIYFSFFCNLPLIKI